MKPHTPLLFAAAALGWATAASCAAAATTLDEVLARVAAVCRTDHISALIRFGNAVSFSGLTPDALRQRIRTLYPDDQCFEELVVMRFGTFGELLPYAARGDRNAMTDVAWMLLKGDKIVQNISEGIRWSRAAIDKGESEATYRLAALYAGDANYLDVVPSFPVDPREAIRILAAIDPGAKTWRTKYYLALAYVTSGAIPTAEKYLNAILQQDVPPAERNDIRYMSTVGAAEKLLRKFEDDRANAEVAQRRAAEQEAEQEAASRARQSQRQKKDVGDKVARRMARCSATWRPRTAARSRSAFTTTRTATGRSRTVRRPVATGTRCSGTITTPLLSANRKAQPRSRSKTPGGKFRLAVGSAG